jgi:hypothetical protein
MQSLNFEAIKAARYLLINLVFIFISTTSSHASIVLVNDPNLGISADGFNITRDTSTGLEWFDLDLSVGRNFDDLTGVDGSNEFLTGGDFEGFRYATHLELTGAVNGPQLDSLYKSLGVSPFGFSSIGGYSSARALISIAGCFGSCANYGYSNGIILADDGITEAAASMETFTNGGSNWGRSNPFTGPILNNPPNRPQDGFPLQQGNWLVRPISVVPIPAAVWLFGTALIGLIGFGKRRKAA